MKSVEKVQKVQEEIHNVNYENILIHLVASNMFVLISMFTKNWGRNWGIFDPNDFLKLFLNKMDFSCVGLPVILHSDRCPQLLCKAGKSG